LPRLKSRVRIPCPALKINNLATAFTRSSIKTTSLRDQLTKAEASVSTASSRRAEVGMIECVEKLRAPLHGEAFSNPHEVDCPADNEVEVPERRAGNIVASRVTERTKGLLLHGLRVEPRGDGSWSRCRSRRSNGGFDEHSASAALPPSSRSTFLRSLGSTRTPASALLDST
jgi:hypothetical protein